MVMAAWVPYAIAGGSALLSGWMGSKSAKKGRRASNAMLEKQLEFQKEQQAKLDKQKEIYKQFKFENPYSAMENPYEGMENVYEDLKVSTDAADFQMEQGAQQRANIMQGLRGAAGGSGIAGLAQSLANQGQLQARQVSAGIAQQEMANEQMRAQGAMSIQQLERQGASAADMAERGGEAMLQEAEMSRQATLLGIQYGGLAGANQGVQSAYSNQMAANTAAMQMQMQNISTFGNVMSNMPWDQMGGGGQPNYSTTQYTPGGTEFSIDPSKGTGYDWSSDRRLKKDIELIGESPSGLNIYSFKYIDNKYGEGTYQGVMSDEIPFYAVSISSDGYDMVDYSKIDVNFKQI